MKKLRVVFVDDELSILDGLRNVLRRQRAVWDMAFAVGGEKALEELEREPADVIVSDMRMPGMDGPALLQNVRDRYPGTARLVLSGHADAEAVMRALPVAHQYLSKPCDAERLVAAIGRTHNLQALLQNDAVRRLVGGLGKLPSVPRTYLAITRAAARPDTPLDDITAIVEQDMALVAKILQIVNSAYFGRPQSLTSIRQAVQYLGIECIKGLSVAGQVFGTLKVAPFEGFSLEGLQEHALLTARVASKLPHGLGRTDDVFTAAVVHDIGRLVLAHGCRDQFAEVMRVARSEHRPVAEVEQEAFGASHAEVGAYLLGIWGLPFRIVETAAYHHRPGLVTDGDRSLLAAVHVADALVSAAAAHPDGDGTAGLDLEFLNSVGVVVDTAAWNDLARRELQPAS